MPDAERGRNVADLWFKIKADTSELDNAYKRLAEIEKLVANFNKELSEVESGSKKFKELSNQLTSLEQQYEKALKKIASLETIIQKQANKEADSQRNLSQAIKEAVASEKLKQETSKASIQNSKAQLEAIKLELEELKKKRAFDYDAKKRAVSDEEVTRIMNTQVKSIRQAEEQNKRLRIAVKNVVGEDKEANQTRAALNDRIQKNTEFIKRNTDAFVRQKMTIGQYKQEIKQAFTELQKGGKTMNNVKSIANGLSGVLKTKVSGGLSSVRDGVSTMIKGFIGAQAVINGFQKMVDAIKSGIHSIVDFEVANSKLAAILGETKTNINELIYDAKRLGATTRYTASEATALQIELAKLGFSKKEILDSTEYVLKFAQATGAELPEAAALAGASIRMFGATTQETEKYVASMAVATTKSALSFSYLQTAMPIVGPVAKAFNFTIEDTLALLGRLADAGFDASMSATATRNIILNLADANGKLAKELGGNVKTLPEMVSGLVKLRDKGIDLASTLELTDKRSVAAFNAFLSGAEKINVLREAVTNVEGDLTTMANTMTDNVQGAILGLSSAWEAFMLSFVNSTGPAKEVIDFFARGLRNIAKELASPDERQSMQNSESISLQKQQMQEFGVIDENLKRLRALYDEKVATGMDANQAEIEAKEEYLQSYRKELEKENKLYEDLQKEKQVTQDKYQNASFWKQALFLEKTNRQYEKQIDLQVSGMAQLKGSIFKNESVISAVRSTQLTPQKTKIDITKPEFKVSNYVDAYQYAKEIKKSTQSIKDALTKSEIDIQQQVIDLKEEGSEKELAQIQLNYDKQYYEIAKRERELLEKLQEEERKKWEQNTPDYKKNNQQFTPTITSLTPEQREPFDKEYSLAYEKQGKAIQDYYKSVLEQYQDYTDERLAIETKFNNDIAALDEQRKAAEKKGDTKQVEKIDRAKTQATKEKGKALMGADYEQLKKSPEYVRAFENLKKTSSETLTSLLGQLENAKQVAAEVLSPDELREYTSTIQDIMDELNSRNPFKALADRKKELAEAEEELAKAKKNLEAVQSGEKVVKSTSYNKDTDKIEKKYLSSAEALKEYNAAKDKAVEADAEVHEAERKVNDVMGELFDSIQNLGSAIGGEAGEIIGVIGDIGQFALMAMSGVESSSKTASAAIQTVEKASVILAIISAAIQIATKIASLFNRTDYMEEFRKEMAKLNYELELAKLNAEISADENSIFGDDLWKNAIKNVELANEAFMKYSDTLNQVSNRRKYTGFMGLLSEINGIKNSFNSLEESIANMQIQVRHKTWFRSAKYSSLKDAVPELFNDDGSINMDALEKFIGSDTFGKLSGENQKYLQEMSDYWKSYQDAVEKVKDYLSDIFGDLGSTMTDALVDAFANGTDAAKVFTDSVSDMLETLAKQMVYSVTLGTLMENAQNEMLDIMKDTSLSEEEKFKKMAGVLDGFVNKAVDEQDRANQLLEKLRQSAAEKGFDIFSPESADSAKEALESFVSDMQSALTSLDVTAKDVSDNIYDYFRQAMINALYEKEYKSKMEELYKSFEDLSADGLSESDMAQLGSQVDQYIEQMMKGVEDVNSLFADKLKDNEDLQSFVDNVKSAMSSIEATAEDVTDNIFEYIRQQMVEKMFADTFQPQIEEFYKKVQEAMADGDITDSERDALRSEAEKLANDIVAAKDILSDTLGITSKNLQKELEEEFKSFSDGILNSLYNAEVTAESVAKDIAESMRKELIEAMYIEQYEPRIKAIWEKWKEYSADGLVTDEERANIKADIDEIGKEVADAAKEISDAWKDSGEEVKKAFESFSDSIKSVLYGAEATAEDVANNIYQYMRNALVDSMFTAQLQPQIQAWYDKYTEFMKDGAIDTAERKTLDEMIAEIQKAGVDIVDAANALFPTLDTGAIKRAEEAAQEAENARNEAEQEWESFSDDILNSLYDIEATAEDISDDMSEYMRKALIKAMYVENFKPQMQKWYNEWQRAMGDDNLTSEEKQLLDSMKQTMVDDMKKEVDAINQFFGTMFSQQASSKGVEAMSQDTGEELNGRFTALQIAGEEIKNQSIQQTGLLSSINEKMLAVYTPSSIENMNMGNITSSYNGLRELLVSNFTRHNNYPERVIEQIASLKGEVANLGNTLLQMEEKQALWSTDFETIAESSKVVAKNSPTILANTDEIKRQVINKL